MWIDDSQYQIRVEADALYHGDYLIEGDISEQVA